LSLATVSIGIDVAELTREAPGWGGMRENSAGKWAREQFGACQLGDVRRTRRLVEMAASAAMRPSGKVAAVFDRMHEREGAYDFLESPQVDAAAVAETMFMATATRAVGRRGVFVALDVSSLTLTDEQQVKGFGPIGAMNYPARGLMVMNALAVDFDGVPLGLIDQKFWRRRETLQGTARQRTTVNQHRPFEQKQGAYFVRAAEDTIRRLRAVDVAPWFVIDREGDNREILSALFELPCVFTIRGKKNRRLTTREEEAHVRSSLLKQRRLGTRQIHLGRNGQRPARDAVVEVRAKEVELRFEAHPTSTVRSLKLWAVLVREIGRGARGADALDWLLYTNAPVSTEDAAFNVVDSYGSRWRVEEFHRTWKKGECNVESAQLRSVDAVVKWATILAAVAVRIERLKYLSRRTPDEPASIEFEPAEIEALAIERRARLRGTRQRVPNMPTIQQATEWIAEMGGWMGLRSSGPPGSITLARGLERLAIYTQALSDVRKENRLRAPI